MEKLMVPDPAVAVTVPPQPLTTLGVVATTRFVGIVSVKLPSMGTTLALLSTENVMVLTLGPVPVPPVVWMVVGLKLLVIEGGAKITMLAFAVPPLDDPRPDAFAV